MTATASANPAKPAESVLEDPRTQQLIQTLSHYLSAANTSIVQCACTFGAEAHAGQMRASGDPYIFHPIEVAQILADMRMDYQTITAAILHDVIEDTDAGKEHIASMFDAQIAELVDGVSKLTKASSENRTEAQAKNLRKMLMAMTRDIRVIIIKLADRLHNMRTLGPLKPGKRQRIARETLEIYAPIAHRLGMNTVRLELEELGFANLHPWRADILKRYLRRMHSHRKDLIDKAEQSIQFGMEQNDIQATVYGREKHLYGIYRKLQKKIRETYGTENVRETREYLAQIRDLYGIRIQVDSIDTCYRALGVVHSLFKPIPLRFKDYIAIPKTNGYQSLHTGLHGPDGVPIEVQIRTEEMHFVAENGIAAHWHYKEGEHDTTGASHYYTNEWLKQLQEFQSTSADSVEFLESVKVDLFPNECYVFSPQGDIYRLPRGATAVDFAYAVHTDVGNRCHGARVDGRRQLLHTPLTSGQMVEIVVDENAHPHPKWLNFVVTAKARSNIRHYLKTLQREDAIRLGDTMLSNALSAHSNNRSSTISAAQIERVLQDSRLASLDDLKAEIGLGERSAPITARRLTEEDVTANKKRRRWLRPLTPRSYKKSHKTLTIRGTEGMVVSMGSCCQPIPGDNIIGFLSTGRGVVIHANDCPNTRNFEREPDRWINVDWGEELERKFTTRIAVNVTNRHGILANVTNCISEKGADIDNVAVEDRTDSQATIEFLLQVFDRKHLANIMRDTRRLTGVQKITRIRKQ